jgi:hypothetical protein
VTPLVFQKKIEEKQEWLRPISRPEQRSYILLTVKSNLVGFVERAKLLFNWKIIIK